jgi:uncharacterized protein (DUF2235 family)
MAKRIVLLADGTGNGLLTQLSNIYRLATTLDRTSNEQLVYYIPGVGTEGFAPLAWLDGATGFGVPSNIRKLYCFLSWYWEPGATIYMFGFSRGAFTIRMLVDLIDKEGLLPREIDGRGVSHLEMERHAKDVWRAYCVNDDPTRKTNLWVRLGADKLRGFLTEKWRAYLKQPTYEKIKQAAAEHARGPENVKIQFVGLFDTVEAYGVPIEELRDLIHFLVAPIKFGGDHAISGKVLYVRQALSLDDERRTFHPIRVSLAPGDFTEHEAARAKDANGRTIPAEKSKPLRVQEVWFSGVHSDVGGGYPDDMTAHCPLTWMIREAEKAAGADASKRLVYRDGTVEEFGKIATPYGPLHDSRAGLAVIYRYAPRYIVDKDQNGHSYCSPTVHHTVVERLVYGYDDYAPLALGAADVVLPDGSVVEAQNGTDLKKLSPPDPSTTDAVREATEQAAKAAKKLDAPKSDEMTKARGFIWLNTQVYVASAATVVLALLALVHGHWAPALLALLVLWILSLFKAGFSDSIHYHARAAWRVQSDKNREKDAPVPANSTPSSVAAAE